MFFGWEDVAVVYTFKQLLFYAGLILVILFFLLYGVSQIVIDNEKLRQENKALRKKIARNEEDRARSKKPL